MKCKACNDEKNQIKAGKTKAKNMCLYWIWKYAKNIEPKETQTTRVNVIESDELYTSVEREKTDFTP